MFIFLITIVEGFFLMCRCRYELNDTKKNRIITNKRKKKSNYTIQTKGNCWCLVRNLVRIIEGTKIHCFFTNYRDFFKKPKVLFELARNSNYQVVELVRFYCIYIHF